MDGPSAVEMKDISKRFGDVVANDRVDFSVKAGEVHALLGENGAGKSTLMSILSGLYQPDEGDIIIDGNPVTLGSPRDAMNLGIGMVHQHFRLVDTFTATENMVLGETGPVWRGRSWLQEKMKEVEQLAERYRLRFPVDRPVWQLSVGERQRVEIVKVLYHGARLLILDEPTSVLTPQEANDLFRTLRSMVEQGKTVIFTTHKLREVFAVADRISVMRNGQMRQTLNVESTNERQLARMMVGRDVVLSVNKEAQKQGEAVVEIEGLSAVGDHGKPALHEVDLTLHQGEITGIAGVAGNGQKELVEVLTGMRPLESGVIRLLGEPLTGASVREVIDRGVALIPEDKMKSGLAGPLGSLDNLLLKTYRRPPRSRWGLLNQKQNRSWAAELIERFDVKTPGIAHAVQQLSGGNQQKLLFAREIDRDPRLLIAVHPTTGLDVGATEIVYRLLLELRSNDRSVLLISEDLEEILRLSDRVIVMADGTVQGPFAAGDVDREQIGLLMAGGDTGEGVAV